MDTTALLTSGLRELGFSFDDDLVTRFVNYADLLLLWNRTVNLTAITEPEKVVSHHLLDSLSVREFVTGRHICDAGSGGGLPGIPLALVCPDKDFILLDSNGKKTRFMTQAKIELGLDNVEVVKARVEDFSSSVDHVISRAFTSLGEFAEKTAPLLTPGGSLLAMKGPGYQDELEAQSWKSVTAHPVWVPGLDEQRYLVEIRI